MELIETVTLTSSAASIEFTSIPQDGTDLVLHYSIRAVNAADTYIVGLFNGSTYAGTRRELYGTGSSALSTSGSLIIGRLNLSGATSNTFGNGQLYIPNYTSTVAKSMSSDSVTENNATTAYQAIMAIALELTTGVTSIQLSTQNGNLAANSSVSLYKITKA